MFDSARVEDCRFYCPLSPFVLVVDRCACFLPLHMAVPFPGNPATSERQSSLLWAIHASSHWSHRFSARTLNCLWRVCFHFSGYVSFQSNRKLLEGSNSHLPFLHSIWLFLSLSLPPSPFLFSLFTLAHSGSLFVGDFSSCLNQNCPPKRLLSARPGDAGASLWAVTLHSAGLGLPRPSWLLPGTCYWVPKLPLLWCF